MASPHGVNENDIILNGQGAGEITDAEKGRFTDSPMNEEDGDDGAAGKEDVREQSDADSGGDDNDDDDGSDSDSDEEEEPALKYSRIEGSVPEVLNKDSASALAVSGNRLLALGTHAGIVHVLDLSGKRIKSYKPHLASIVDVEFDETGDFIATASIDGQIYVRSLTTTEFYTSNLKRPMRTIALEPHFANKRSTRAFVAGGLAGNLVLYDKGWLGHRETIISSGEGPIWQVRWVDGTTTGSGGFIAWANDLGVKIYHPTSRMLLTYIDRPPNSPRAELFKPNLQWQDESTLLIAWADSIKVARIRPRSDATGPSTVANLAPYTVEVTSAFQMDACVVAGIIPHPMPSPPSNLANSKEKLKDEVHEEDVMSTHSKDASSVRTSATTRTTSSKPNTNSSSPEARRHPQRRKSILASAPPLTTFLLLTYIPPPSLLAASRGEGQLSEGGNDDRAVQKRARAERPELQIVNRTTGEELANDVLGVREYEKWGCNEYGLAVVPGEGNDVGVRCSGVHAKGTSGANSSGKEEVRERCYVVMSPKDLIFVRKRDRRDRIKWLVARGKWEEALREVEELERVEAITGVSSEKAKQNASDSEGGNEDELSVQVIGQKYIHHLLEERSYAKAASLLPKVCGRGKIKAIAHRWEEWLWEFAGRGELQAVIPYVPTDAPRLDHLVYEMVLGHLLSRDLPMLVETVKSWPREIYDVGAVVVAVKAKLEKVESGIMERETEGCAGKKRAPRQEDVVLLMECLAELYSANRQPGKALSYYLRLRRPNVFELIREHNLFTDVQDQVLLLVEFDHELMERRRKERAEQREGQVKEMEKEEDSEAIKLLVDNIHSISINRVVQQLQKRPDYLFLYLDALVEKDPHLVSGFADLQVKMYAEFATARLIDFLRASNYYNLEQAYNICKERDLVPEMVFLLGRMGNNKQALTLIIERLGDVHRAIEFAKSQNDDDLWEDLLRYSETRPTFIRGLLENVGVEISPVRLIRRIKNGLEIPGLKEALIKILHDFQLQIELMEGCRKVLEGDCVELAEGLGKKQGGGFWLNAKTKCLVCSKPLQQHPHDIPSSDAGAPTSSLTLLFLCRHVVHASCASGGNHLPLHMDPILRGIGYGSEPGRGLGGISGTIAFESMIRPRLRQGCPVCHANANGGVGAPGTAVDDSSVAFGRAR